MKFVTARRFKSCTRTLPWLVNKTLTDPARCNSIRNARVHLFHHWISSVCTLLCESKNNQNLKGKSRDYFKIWVLGAHIVLAVRSRCFWPSMCCRGVALYQRTRFIGCKCLTRHWKTFNSEDMLKNPASDLSVISVPLVSACRHYHWHVVNSPFNICYTGGEKNMAHSQQFRANRYGGG